MSITPAITVSDLVSENGREHLCFRLFIRASALLFSILITFVAIQAQAVVQSAGDAYVVEGQTDAIAYGMGRSVRVTGTVKNGAIALGGDVIVQGTVEGDVAAIGGSVIQLAGSRIGGDIIVIGGGYRPYDQKPDRGSTTTIVYAGYEEELRNMFRNPAEMVSPHLSTTYVGLRILAILFWFVVSLTLTAVMPDMISEGIARLQLTNIRVALIGLAGAAIIGAGVAFSLHYLPTPLSALIGLAAFFFIIAAGLFGRVVIYAATGRWLQRKFLPASGNSESVALLLGTAFWIALSSLPYVWPLVLAFVIVTSVGLTLTARYRVGRIKSQIV